MQQYPPLPLEFFLLATHPLTVHSPPPTQKIYHNNIMPHLPFGRFQGRLGTFQMALAILNAHKGCHANQAVESDNPINSWGYRRAFR